MARIANDPPQATQYDNSGENENTRLMKKGIYRRMYLN